MRGPLGSQAIQGGQVLPLRDLSRPMARRAAVRRADGRRRRPRREVASTVPRVAPRCREGRPAAACVRRWLGAWPQTRRRNRAHRAGRAALARVAAHVLSVWSNGLCVECTCEFSPPCAPVRSVLYGLRRSGGSTCRVGRTTTARRVCIRLRYVSAKVHISLASLGEVASTAGTRSQFGNTSRSLDTRHDRYRILCRPIRKQPGREK